MGFVLDLILMAVAVGCVLYGYSKGFFKAVFSLMSGICALFCTYAFTPVVSSFVCEKIVLPGVAKSINATFVSIAEAGKDSANKLVYDTTLLIESRQFSDTVKQCGADLSEVEALLSDKSVDALSLIEAAAVKVATPIADTFAKAVSFAGIFILSLIIIRLVVFAIGIVLKLPVLKEIDKKMGLVFGIISGVFFACVLSFAVDALAGALAVIAPGSFSPDVVESTLLLELLARYNPIGLIVSNIL